MTDERLRRCLAAMVDSTLMIAVPGEGVEPREIPIGRRMNHSPPWDAVPLKEIASEALRRIVDDGNASESRATLQARAKLDQDRAWILDHIELCEAMFKMAARTDEDFRILVGDAPDDVLRVLKKLIHFGIVSATMER